MPKVDAVGAGAEPAQGRDAERAGGVGAAAGDGGDQGGGGGRGGEQPPWVEPGFAPVALLHDQDDGDEAEKAERVEQASEPGACVGPLPAPRMPDEPERDAEQDGERAGVAAEVDAGRVFAGLVEADHPEQRSGREREHDGEQCAAGDEAGERGEEQGPEQVELLLDGEGPEVAQLRGAIEGLEVGDVADDQVPVGDVSDSGEHFAEVGEQLVAEHGDGVEGGDGKHERERGQEAAGTAGPEGAEVHAVAALALADQQGGDQEAADDEEDINAEEAAGEPGFVGVEDDDGEHGEGADAVERGQVGHASVGRLGRSG